MLDQPVEAVRAQFAVNPATYYPKVLANPPVGEAAATGAPVAAMPG
jgi:hypothetical protein